MYVACPSCKALYAISADQLRLAEGQVRCGRCGTLFNATNAVFASPREALEHTAPLQPDVAREIDELVERALDQVPGETLRPPGVPEPGVPHHEGVEGERALVEEPEVAEAEAAEPEIEALEVEEPEVEEPEIEQAGFERAEAVGRPLARLAGRDFYAQPVGAEFSSGAAVAASSGEAVDGHGVFELSEAMLFHDEPHHQSHTRWGAIAAAVFLTLTLVAQYAWWDRNRLAQITALRPALESACKLLGCELPLRHELAQVEMIQREVRDHPSIPDALLINAEFANRAPYTQAYPVLQISFSDVSGTPVAIRRFLPAQYLHGKNPARGMAPGEQARVTLEVVDPGERAVSFQFDFL